MNRQEKIEQLKQNIAQGEEFLRQGYDCGAMIAISQTLLNELLKEEE